MELCVFECVCGAAVYAVCVSMCLLEVWKRLHAVVWVWGGFIEGSPSQSISLCVSVSELHQDHIKPGLHHISL